MCMVGLQIHAILHEFGPEFYFFMTSDLDATSSTWSSLLICQKLGNLEKQQIFVKINNFSLFYSNWTKSWQEISVYFLFNHKKIYYKKNVVSFRIHVLYTVWIRINEKPANQEIADRGNSGSWKYRFRKIADQKNSGSGK